MSKNTVKAADLRAKTEKELETRAMELRKEQFNLRFQKATGQLANTAIVRKVKKELAKILTVLGERTKESSKPASKKKTKG